MHVLQIYVRKNACINDVKLKHIRTLHMQGPAYGGHVYLHVSHIDEFL